MANRRVPEVVAHRGDPVHHRENTLPAIIQARQDGARMIEVDVRETSNGIPVLLHDAETARLWGRDLPVHEQTHAQVAELFHEGMGVGIPTLEDALRAAGPARLLLDFPDPRAVPAAIVTVARAVQHDGAVLPAFTGDVEAMRAVRAADPDAEIWLTWTTGLPIDDEVLASVRPDSWNPPHEQITAESAAQARARGLAVTCWTVNDVGTARTLAALGVDAIISDRAADIRKALVEDARTCTGDDRTAEAPTS